MASEKLIGMLNEAIAAEVAVSIQYMWQHVKIYGFDHIAVADELKKIAIQEMIHAEEIAERIDYLGGDPTTTPAEINVGKTPQEMIEINLQAEEGAIKLYNEIIEQAISEKDYVTKKLFEGILAEEEDHHNLFRGLLEK